MSETATPAARHALYAVLEDVLGHEHADTLMTYLPEHRSDEAATKADLASLENSMRRDLGRSEARFDGLETRFDGLEARFDGLETRFDGLEARFDGLETRFDGLEARFERIEGKFDRSDERFADLQKSMITTVATTMTGLTAIFSAVVLIINS